MNRPNTTPAIALGALALFFLAMPAEATVARALSLKQLAARSTHVVVADVGDARSYLGENGNIYTETTLHVRRALKGKPKGTTLVVRQMGGQVGDRAMMIPGDAELVKGSKIVVFLADREPGSGVVFLTALAQSKFDVIGQTQSGDLLLQRNVEGLLLLDAKNQVVKPEKAEGLTLDTLQREIAGAGAK